MYTCTHVYACIHLHMYLGPHPSACIMDDLNQQSRPTMFLAADGGFDEARKASMGSVTTGDKGLSSSAVMRLRT